MLVWGGGQAVTTTSDKSVNPLLCILLEENCRNVFHVTVIEFDYMKKPFVYKNRNNFKKSLFFIFITIGTLLHKTISNKPALYIENVVLIISSVRISICKFQF